MDICNKYVNKKIYKIVDIDKSIEYLFIGPKNPKIIPILEKLQAKQPISKDDKHILKIIYGDTKLDINETTKLIYCFINNLDSIQTIQKKILVNFIFKRIVIIYKLFMITFFKPA